MRNLLPPSDEDAIKTALQGMSSAPFRLIAADLSFSLSGPNATVSIAWSGRKQRFVVEYKATGTPKQIDLAIGQVLRFASELPGTAPMLIAPFLSTEQIEKLVGKGISAVDLSGNFGVIAPKRWLVARTGNKNQYPSSAPIKNVFRGTSSLVPRALLTRGPFRGAREIIQDIATVAPITASTVSKVLSTLSESLLIAKDKNIRLLQPDKLLSELSVNYEPVKPRKRVTAKLSIADLATAATSCSMKEPDFLYAMDGTELYTVMPSSNPLTKVYTTSISTLVSGLELDTDSRFPNVEIVEWPQEAIYYGRRMIDGLYRVSPLQVYLELNASGPRERQTAERLRAEILAGPERASQ